MEYSTLRLPITLMLMALITVAFFSNHSSLHAEDDHGDYRSTSTSLSIGTGAIPGIINPSDTLFDVDYFSFQATRGIQYTFLLDEITVVDANIAIINSLSRGSDSSPEQELTVSGGQKTVTWIARTTDTYYVEVSGTLNNSDGSFYLGDYSISGFEDTRLVDRHSDDKNGATSISAGNVYQGAISPWSNQPSLTNTVDGGDDFDYFSFQAQRGVKYNVEVDLDTSEGVEIAIHSAFAGMEKSNDGIGNTLDWISSATTTYYISVSGTSRMRDSQGTYAIKLDAESELLDRHADSIAGATVVSFGNSHQGSISPSDDLDYFSFPAQRGVKYILEASLGSADGVDLTIINGGGTSLASNGGVGTKLEWLAPANETFLAVIAASPQVLNVIGTYSLNLSNDITLQDYHSDLPSAASILGFGNAHPGAVSPETDRDYFSLPAERGVNYSLELELLTANGAVISIENPAGDTLNSTNGLGTDLDWTAASNGLFYVVVSHSPQATESIGTYTLKASANTSLEDRHSDTAVTGTNIGFGNAIAGAISPASDYDYFRFYAERGVNYSIELELLTANGAVISIENPAGDTLSSTNGLGTGLGWTAASTGPFHVVVSHSPQATEGIGTYTLKVSANTSLEDRHSDTADTGTLLSFGTIYQGAISPQPDLDYFSFPADRGVEYLLDVTYGSASAVSFEVGSQGGTAETDARNFGENNLIRWTAPASATYYVKVSASPKALEQTGTYTLKITPDLTLQDRHSDSAVSGTNIGFGNAISGAISPASDYDYFKFSAEQGTSYTVDVKPGTTEGVRFSVENQAAGFSQSNFGVEQRLEWIAPESGTYILALSASGQVDKPVGTYSITVTRQSDTLPATPKVVEPEPQSEEPLPKLAKPDSTAMIITSRVSPLGGVIRVPVELNKAAGITNLGFTLNYDPNSLRVITVERGSRLTKDSFSYDTDTPGQVRFGFAETKGSGDEGTAAVVSFQVIGTESSVSPITLSDALVNHQSEEPLTMQLVGADFRVGSKISGDADGDSRVTAIDALMALKIASSQSSRTDLSLDVNNDGKISIEDAQIILNMARPG